MERKRKLPPRAAARIEQAAKRRTSTPPAESNASTRSATPATSTTGGGGGDEGASKKNTPAPAPARNQLPNSVQAGKPLPTVEKAQPLDLPVSEYQTVQESGVLAESLVRSRHRWLNEGIFEKYWSKPSKRRGIAVDDPKNPPKDSMVKIGQATLIVEPHTFDVTFYGVKDPKPTPALPANRPILMYGPSRGMMPPPPPPSMPTTPVTAKQSLPQPATPQFPTQSPVATPAAPAAMPPQGVVGLVPAPQQQPPFQPLQATQPAQSVPELVPTGTQMPSQATTAPAPSSAPPTPVQGPAQTPPSIKAAVKALPTIPVASPAPPAATGLAVKEELSQGPAPIRRTVSPFVVGNATLTLGVPVAPTPHAPQPPYSGPIGTQPPVSPLPASAPKPGPSPVMTPSPAMVPGRPPTTSVPPPGSNPATPEARPPNAPSPSPPPAREDGDSIVYVLAEKASSDPTLRDLMKRVASGSATKEDLDRFQSTIDQITAEKARVAAAAAVPATAHTPHATPATLPTAHQLYVDGRTVHFFAEEVRIILDIVLRGNPMQQSHDLQPPAGSDPLIVELVKTALDDRRVRDLVFRIGENRALPTDPSDLKVILDACKKQVALRQQQLQRAVAPGPVPMGGAAPPGTGMLVAAPVKAGGNHQQHHLSGSQALRSKGPPPPPRLELSAVVLEFAGGTGDRYLFPRFSVLEFGRSAQSEPEVVASFLLVRKGSASEYGADPELDYYEPMTVRIRVAAQQQQQQQQAGSQKVLDALAHVVAPVDEVRRYMDNIMSTMTRAEYLLLAMRLPRPGRAGTEGADSEGEKEKTEKGEKEKRQAPRTNGHSGRSSSSSDSSYTVAQPQAIKGVLWTATAATSASPAGSAATPRQRAVQRIVEEDQQYQTFIAGLLPKEVD